MPNYHWVAVFSDSWLCFYSNKGKKTNLVDSMNGDWSQLGVRFAYNGIRAGASLQEIVEQCYNWVVNNLVEEIEDDQTTLRVPEQIHVVLVCALNEVIRRATSERAALERRLAMQ